MKPLSVHTFLEKADHWPVADVRSPAEHLEGHIPGAQSLPLFTDEERARVGTCYKQKGKDEAVLLGLDIIGPRMSDMVRQALTIAPDKKLLIHCWRGGMRSQSVAWLLERAGFTCHTLDGGYKAYRQHVLQAFEQPMPLLILGGGTGSGKTDILHQLKALGEQVIDLEGLAHHKGSAFGNLTSQEQPTTEQFHAALYDQWKHLDPDRTVWVEDESFSIGSCRLPYPLWEQMKSAPCIMPDLPMDVRVQILVNDYGQYDKKVLAEAIGKIQRKLGDKRYREALADLASGDLHAVAANLLQYYDKTYREGLAKKAEVLSLPLHTDDSRANAIALREAWYQYEVIRD